MSKNQRPLILVSNDDGIHAPGIQILAKRLKQLGRVVVVAPDQERSATSHSLTLHRPLRVKKISQDYYKVNGTPTDCVSIAINELLPKKPDLLVSGINRGGNLGDDVHYSGTVSAAVEGAILGVPGIAFSLMAYEEDGKYEPSAGFAVKLVRKVLKENLPKGIILNVNIPDLAVKKIKGYRFTKQGKRDYGEIIAERIDPRGKKYYWIGGNIDGFVDIQGSDCNALQEGYISITPIHVNLTDLPTLKKIQDWKL